jgi:transcriptional regulator with XRE-family HTH domain
MTWKQELGGQIRDARKRARLSQKELAVHLSVSREQLSNYENGKSAPAVNVVAEIAAALNTEFEIAGCKIAKDDLIRTLVSPPEQQLCFAYDTEHRFTATTLTIRPSHKSIVINAIIARTRVL